MRLATFNVENLFERASAMNLSTWKQGKPALDDLHRLNELIQQASYSDATKAELLKIMGRHRGLLTQGKSKFIILRENHGKLIARPRGKPAEIRVDGRDGWIGWFEPMREPVRETATENTARVISLLQADILCVVEAENRPGLKTFNDLVIKKITGQSFRHAMLIDGNDARGIDVGILANDGFTIEQMRSHVDDEDAKGTIFSRDCAEYDIRTRSGNRLLVMVNHFKSKGFGKPAESAAKRLRQATKVRAIYDARLAEGYDFIAIAGDLNETPCAPPMAPLIKQNSKLIDIMAHPKFQGDGRPGTHGNGTKSGKLDYILMSPKLAAKVVRGGIERRGVWGGGKGTLFPHLPTIKTEMDAASDHAALWVELDV